MDPLGTNMPIVVVNSDANTISVRIDGPHRLRASLRQSLRPADVTYDADHQLWTINTSAWPTACVVFHRFQVQVRWDAAAGNVDAEIARVAGIAVERERTMANESNGAIPGANQGIFTVSISGNGLKMERDVDFRAAWAIVSVLFGRDAAEPQPVPPSARRP